MIDNQHSGVAIAIAWPETKCKQAGAWYEPLMTFLGFNQNGYYKVGHAAIILVAKGQVEANYYDFGRYHSPFGKGRVRSAVTDHDLIIHTTAKWSDDGELINQEELLAELYHKPSCHGSGYVLASCTSVNYSKAVAYIKKQQERTFITYGPLAWNGTNCSRFVAGILNHGDLSFWEMLRLNFQISVSASPVGNVNALSSDSIIIGHPEAEEIAYPVLEGELSTI